MAGRLLGRVGPREGEMRRLVAHDRPQLVQTGPVREDPDDVGPVRRVRALEAVARPGSRRRGYRVDEGDVGVRDAKLPAGVGQRGERDLDVAWRRRRDPGALGLDVDAEPGVPVEVRKGLPADRERSVGRRDLDVRDADAWFHQGQCAGLRSTPCCSRHCWELAVAGLWGAPAITGCRSAQATRRPERTSPSPIPSRRPSPGGTGSSGLRRVALLPVQAAEEEGHSDKAGGDQGVQRSYQTQ